MGTVTVALNTDEFIYEYKCKTPVMDFAERAAVLESCKYVERVIPNFGGANSKPSIELIMPDLVVIGSDWARKDYYKQMQFDQDWLDERDIGLVYLPYTNGISSTQVKGRMAVD